MLWVLRKPVGVTTRSLAFFLQGKHIIYKLLPSASMSKYHSVLLLMEKILHQSIPRRSHFSIGFYTSQVVHRSWSPRSLCKANGPAEDRSNACMEYCKLLKLQDEPVLARGLDAKNKPSLEAKWMSMKIEEQSAHMICKFMLMQCMIYCIYLVILNPVFPMAKLGQGHEKVPPAPKHSLPKNGLLWNTSCTIFTPPGLAFFQVLRLKFLWGEACCDLPMANPVPSKGTLFAIFASHLDSRLVVSSYNRIYRVWRR